MQAARISALLTAVDRPGRHIEFPKDAQGKHIPVSEFYGANVFTLKTMQTYLPKPVYAKFVQQVKVGVGGSDGLGTRL
jgi:glutamine synthetase